MKVQCDNSRILRGLHGYCYFQLNYALISMPCVVEHHNSGCLCPSVVEDRYWFLVLVRILQLLLKNHNCCVVIFWRDILSQLYSISICWKLMQICFCVCRMYAISGRSSLERNHDLLNVYCIILRKIIRCKIFWQSDEWIFAPSRYKITGYHVFLD